MVIVSFDMTEVASHTRQNLTKKLKGSGWTKLKNAKTTFRYSKQDPITAIARFM